MTYCNIRQLLKHLLHENFSTEEMAVEAIEYLEDEYIDNMDEIETTIENLVIKDVPPAEFKKKVVQFLYRLDKRIDKNKMKGYDYE